MFSKRSGVRALFDREFVNKGIIGKEHGRFYSEVLNLRRMGDYRDFSPSLFTHTIPAEFV